MEVDCKEVLAVLDTYAPVAKKQRGCPDDCGCTDCDMVADLRALLDAPAPISGVAPAQEEMAEGHLFEFSMRSWGVSRVVGDSTYFQSDWTLDPIPVRVRAWNLRDALLKAAKLPITAWFSNE